VLVIFSVVVVIVKYLCGVELDEDDMALMVEETGSDELKNTADSATDAADAAAKKDVKKEEEPLPDYDAVVAPADVEGC